MIVIDCSYAMALVMTDERRPASLGLIEGARLLAPPIWVYEVANALSMAVRRGRLAAEPAALLARRLEDYGVGIDHAELAIHACLLAAQRHELTAYYAAYLDLAQHRRCALATLDERLARAARSAGLAVHE